MSYRWTLFEVLVPHCPPATPHPPTGRETVAKQSAPEATDFCVGSVVRNLENDLVERPIGHFFIRPPPSHPPAGSFQTTVPTRRNAHKDAQILK